MVMKKGVKESRIRGFKGLEKLIDTGFFSAYKNVYKRDDRQLVAED